MPQSIPKVAQVEDYDSDESSVKPGTRQEARRKATTSAPPKSSDRFKNGHVDGSDSGYSSRTSGTHASNASAGVRAAGPMQPPPRPATAQGQARPKPVVHRTDSHQSQSTTRPRAPSRSGSTSRRNSEQCDDPNCGHSSCLAVRYPQRRYSNTISQQQAAQYAAQYASSSLAYQSVPQYQYAQTQQTSQTVPQLSAYPRPRAGSTSRQARPISIHGYPCQAPSGGSTPGPPPSASAYQTVEQQWAHYYQQLQLQQQQQQRAYQQQQAYANAQAQAYCGHPQQSPVQTSPTSPKFSTSARLQRAYSARATTPAGAPAASSGHHPSANLNRTASSRQVSARAYNVPGAYVETSSSGSESESESEESSDEMSDGEYERDRRARARDSRLMSSSSQRRPSFRKQYPTAPVLPTVKTSRESLQRNPRSDHVSDYVSSDNMDSDRTTRAIVDRPRVVYTDSSRSSRRPSLSTTASSGRTRATTMSSATSGMANLVLEGKNRRQIEYMSKRDQAALHQKYAREQAEEEQRRQDAIEAYQDAIRGGKMPELTSEKLRMQQMHSSHAPSVTHSRKSSRSSSRAYQPTGGMKIESGGTIIHIYGDQKVEMRPGEDGATGSIVIGNKSGRESTYNGGSSKSSGSRVGRSHRGSDVGAGREETIREEYGTEQAAA